MVYAIAIPVALVLGYALSTGLGSTGDQSNLFVVVLAVLILILPILLKWHHILLIFFWNAVLIVPFFPGRPPFWLLLAVLSFGISWLNGLLGGSKFLKVPELTRPLLFLALVVFVTGVLRGGIGLNVMGSANFGGRNYVFILGAIIGYFALTAVRIPPAETKRTAATFFLSAMTCLLGNVILMLGPAFYFLFLTVSTDYLSGEATTGALALPGVERFMSLTVASSALVCYFLARWGFRGTFSYGHPWRGVLFIATILLGLLGGYRSVVLTIAILLACQFCIEGLWLTHFMPILAGIFVFAGGMVFLFSEDLPLPVQRAVSFLPVKVDPGVAYDAEASLEWRTEMWAVVVKQIPHYLMLGKGYSIDPDELYWAMTGVSGSDYIKAQESLVAGDYHNGPLSVIVPLGLWGAVGFLWLLVAGVSVLYRNFRYGDPALHNINAFLLAFFVMQSLDFLLIFGAFNGQLYLFTGLLGMSVSLNGGAVQPRRVIARAAGIAVVTGSHSPVSVRV
jgi:hypothetical protein